jgi:uncharacterized protein
MKILRYWAPYVPYAAVLIGLIAIHNAWVTLLSYHAGIVFFLIFDRKRGNNSRRFYFKNVAWGITAILFGILGGVLLYFLWPFLGITLDFGKSLAKLGLNSSSWIVFISYFSIVNPILEELYWRGYLGKDDLLPIVRDLLFSGYHLLVLAMFVGIPWLLVVFIILGAAAWFWRQLARISGGLILPIISHMAADLTLILVIYHYSRMLL